MEVINVQRVEDKYARYIASTPDQDDRPVVKYKPFGFAGVEVGGYAMIIPIDHYNAQLVTNGGIARTGTVLAYDSVTGSFETRRTRYELDAGYEH